MERRAGGGLAVALLFLVAPQLAHAQSTVTGSITGGGGQASGPRYSLWGTVGQPVEPPGSGPGQVRSGLLFVLRGVQSSRQGPVPGDVDGDGEVTSGDAVLVLRFVAGLQVPTAEQRVPADIDGDGTVSAGDAVLVLRRAAGLSPKPVAAGQPHPSSPVSADLALELRPDGAPCVVAAIERPEGMVGGELLVAYDPGIGPAAEVQLAGLSVDALSATNAGVPGEVRVSFAEPVGGSDGGLIVLSLVLPGAQGQEAFRLGIAGQGYDATGLAVAQIAVDRVLTALPSEYALAQNHPNPFNPATALRYDLPEPARVLVEVYNAVGQPARRLVDGRVKAGRHTVTWDGRDARGRQVGPGTYLCRLSVEGGRYTAVRRMTLVK
ncbi:MAG: dockerin type I domain-containing protein [Candidatus Latescibacterota bacterium]